MEIVGMIDMGGLLNDRGNKNLMYIIEIMKF